MSGACYARHRAEEFIKFMDQVVSEYCGSDLHVILDNFSTHKGEEVGSRLKKRPNVKLHHTSAGSSWMNQIEIWFRILMRQAIRRAADKVVSAVQRAFPRRSRA